MSPWTVVDGLGDADRSEVDALLGRVEREQADEPLTEATEERRVDGTSVRHALRRDTNGALTGYAVLVDDDEGVEAEPALGTYDDDLARLVAEDARHVALLLRAVPADTVSRLEVEGWRERRALHRLRRPLPAEPPPATELVVRPFEPGRDEVLWVEANNAAFAGHPTQGHMTVDALRVRERSPWFDPKGFLLVLDDERLVASCWTKVHRFDRGDVGEIYVISVAPGAQGRGLGRLAVLAGLDHLSRAGLRVAELFVEESNGPALALYHALGFEFASRVVELARAQPTPTARPTA